MNKYEIMFIVKASLEENTIKEVSKSYEKLLKDFKANIKNSKELGQKKLAYPIKEESRGYYFLLNVEANAEAVKEFDRKARLDESVLRHLIIKEEE